MAFRLEQSLYLPYVFDLELSGKCNTVCTFCPRDEMKRGEQVMTPETFEHVFYRLKEYAQVLEGQDITLPEEKVSTRLGSRENNAMRILLCGMGESLINPHCADWVARIRRDIGVRLSIVTNGLMLKDTIVEKLIAADVTVLFISVPGIDEASYTKYIPLPWDRVLSNIERAHARMPGRVQINIPIADDAPFTADQALAFWKARGIPVNSVTHCHTRGGFLRDGALTGRFGISDSHFCGIIVRHHFIAWDGRILSCCHDLHAENVFGHVSDTSFLDVARAKTRLMEKGPDYRICTNCNDGDRHQRVQILRTPPGRAVMIS